MGRVKPNSSAVKRFKITASGKIKRKRSNKRHILTKKATDRKRRLGQYTLVSDADMRNVKFMLKI
ncbi:MAG: 50S ribosomal protein L35 [Microscillaceae bacterium]|nr:50S ribosomal protein L35 [Microscillaceae bacterium]MDW8460571.1 50S ribosomal protein L35 [Cytophagales bacterium]